MSGYCLADDLIGIEGTVQLGTVEMVLASFQRIPKSFDLDVFVAFDGFDVLVEGILDRRIPSARNVPSTNPDWVNCSSGNSRQCHGQIIAPKSRLLSE